MTELNGTVAVITGAGRGIGREIALHQAQGGAKVAVLARTAREIDETASVITGVGGVAIAIPVDLVDRLAVEDALARVAGELGAIGLLVNNHGVPETLARRQTWANNVEDWLDGDDNTNLVYLTEAKLGPLVSRSTRVFKCPSDREPAANGERIRSVSMNAMVGDPGEQLDGYCHVLWWV